MWPDRDEDPHRLPENSFGNNLLSPDPKAAGHRPEDHGA